MVKLLHANAAKHGITLFGIDDPRQGILHIVPPEQGITQPGLLICGADSHTSTHGAFGALAFGIGASEMMHVLATQMIWQRKPKTLRVTVDGTLGLGVRAKDVILAIIAKIGIGGGAGHVIEYAGSTIRRDEHGSAHDRVQHVDRSRRARRHGRAGRHDLRLHGRPAVRAERRRVERRRSRSGRRCRATPTRAFDREVPLDAAGDRADGDLGHQPRAGAAGDRATCRIRPSADDDEQRAEYAAALDYMGLQPGMALQDIAVDRVFIGSCTNAASRTCAPRPKSRGSGKARVPAWVVPGSRLVKAQAEREGLDRIFRDAGFEWRDPGLLAVHRDQRRPAPAGRALRVDLEPQLPRPAGHRRPHASREPRDGGRGGDHRAADRRARAA